MTVWISPPAPSPPSPSSSTGASASFSLPTFPQLPPFSAPWIQTKSTRPQIWLPRAKGLPSLIPSPIPKLQGGLTTAPLGKIPPASIPKHSPHHCSRHRPLPPSALQYHRTRIPAPVAAKSFLSRGRNTSASTRLSSSASPSRSPKRMPRAFLDLETTMTMVYGSRVVPLTLTTTGQFLILISEFSNSVHPTAMTKTMKTMKSTLLAPNGRPAITPHMQFAIPIQIPPLRRRKMKTRTMMAS